MIDRVQTITLTAELESGKKVTSVQVGLGLLPEELIQASIYDAINDAGMALITQLGQGGQL